jgi:hypothetical protein
MAKCIKYLDNNKIVRVTDQQAFAMVQGGAAIYVPKSEWKKQQRQEVVDEDSQLSTSP